MQVSILGAGAMGSLFGALLKEAGEDVLLIDVNQTHVFKVRSEGLRLESKFGDRVIAGVSACLPHGVERAAELLMVFTKASHTKDALANASKAIGPDTMVLTLQNGLGNVETIANFVKPENIMVGVTTWPAEFIGPGRVRSHGMGTIRMSAADGVMRSSVVRVSDSLNRAGLQCELDTDVWTAIWEKVAFNSALNTICAVSRCSVDQLDEPSGGIALAFDIASEVISVAHAAGVSADMERCKKSISSAIAGHRGHKPSMLQDLLAGRQTEINSINGAVSKLALKLGVKTPCVNALYALVQVSESALSMRQQ